MIDLIQQQVRHIGFGDGIIVTCDDHNHITVDFKGVRKTFSYPTVFDGFLTLLNHQLAEKVSDEIKTYKEEVAKAREAQLSSIASSQHNKTALDTAEKKRSVSKATVRRSIAFKCNYCDGGKNKQRIGYAGVCSDELINYNIGFAKHTWCSSDECQCLQRYNDEISHAQLVKSYDVNGFVCYESVMLTQWRALAGIVQNGENKGTPMKLNGVYANSLCVLTTRIPYAPESERFIFAVFIIDDSFEGGLHEEGYVSANNKYRIALSMPQAEQVRFWNYHANDNKPTVPVWSSGLHRYLTNTEAVQILQAIAQAKKATTDEDLANEMLIHFCTINAIDMQSIGSPHGALFQKDD